MQSPYQRAVSCLIGTDIKMRRLMSYWAASMLLYVVCVVLLWSEVRLQVIATADAEMLGKFLLAGPMLFYGLIRASRKIGLSIAALAGIQGSYAVFATIASYAIAGPMRGATLSLLLMALLFCSRSLTPRASHILSGIAIFLLGFTMLCMVHLNPAVYSPAQEAVHFMLAAGLLATMAFLTGQFSHLRAYLQAQKRELTAAVARIEIMATRDDLTTLPNRAHMRELLKHEAHRHRREGQTMCVAILDLDHFKRVNDNYGHVAGDTVLRKFAELAQASLRATDVLARWGGEEFFLLMPNTPPQSALLVLERTRAQMEAVDWREIDPALQVTFSAGITALAQGEKVNDAIQRADNALYQAKGAGRNQVRMFDAGMEAALAERTQLERELYEGLRLGEFRLLYQPQVDVGGKIVAVEALLRWQHPRRGLVTPDKFIPLAEEMGLIVPLGQWVLNEACRQLREWSTSAATAGLRVSVNVSARQLRHADFLAQVQRALDEHAVNAVLLRLELTESSLVSEIEEAIALMGILKERGVSFSLDDFGTGYSSLAYLKRLPIDELKIDKSFVRDVSSDANDSAIACTVIALGRSLQLQVIAEGVEQEDQRRFLQQNGCAFFQGYLFGRPLEPARIEDMLARQPPVAA